MYLLDPQKNREEFLRLLEDLRECLIIVEGKHDVLALKGLGISNIFPMNGKSPVEIVEKIYKYQNHLNCKESSVVILTDFDAEGKKLALMFKRLLQKYHIKVNPHLRNKLKRFGRTRIEDFKRIGM